MLKRQASFVVGMAGKMDLAILADDLPALVDENRSVVVTLLPVFDRELGVAEIESHAHLARAFEQGPRRGVWHLALEEAVDLRFVLHPPARKKCCERQLGIDDQIGAAP